jgi:hypothetical protein
VQAGHLDIGSSGIDADHVGSKPRHRLADKPAATADIEEPQPGKGFGELRVNTEMRAQPVADEAEPHRVELVQGLHLAVGVPPLGRKPVELLNFCGIECRSGRVIWNALGHHIGHRPRQRAGWLLPHP